jgi:hypothetical protein
VDLPAISCYFVKISWQIDWLNKKTTKLLAQKTEKKLLFSHENWLIIAQKTMTQSADRLTLNIWSTFFGHLDTNVRV